MGLFTKLKDIILFKESQKTKESQIFMKGLEKTRSSFGSQLNLLSTKYHKVTEEYFEELENILIMADIGINTVTSFMARLRKRVKNEHIVNPSNLKEIIVDELFIIYVNEDIVTDKINLAQKKPTIILVVGVNGVGKTTSLAKLAYKYKKEGLKVMLIGADTFRAGAVEQLQLWAEKVGVLFYGRDNVDPSSVIFDGIKKASEEDVDLILIDTAGRLHNKINLMNELLKINKVIGTKVAGAPHETLLVIDATTGQNAIMQAKAFKEITNLTGIILTKLDGTAKGGIVLAIKEEVGLPVKFVGLGEKMTDLIPFDIEDYIYGLFKDII